MTAFDVTTATYESSFDVVAIHTPTTQHLLSDIWMRADGLMIFTSDPGSLTEAIVRYDLSTAWDVTTATLAQSLPIGSVDTAVQGVHLSSDGAILVFVGETTDSVYRYDLSTAWDLSSASPTSSFSVAAQDSAPMGLTFSPDGSGMFVAGSTNDDVYRYTLSTAWDITTASFTSALSVTDDLRGLWFSDDGTILLTAHRSADWIRQYTLSTAWDVTTASLFGAFATGTQEGSPQGVWMRADGELLFIGGSDSQVTTGAYAVHRYYLVPQTTPGGPTVGFIGFGAWT